MQPDGSNRIRLIAAGTNNSSPTWSSDSKAIAFVSLRDGNSEIYAMNADGSAASRLTNNSASDTQPCWAANAATSVPPAVSISDASTLEGNAGTKLLTFSVTLSKASTKTVTVHYATQDGRAAAVADYAAAAGDLVFDPGQMSKNISITILGDLTFEPNEYFSVVLSAATEANIADGEAVGTISNDDLAATPTGKIVFVSSRDGNSEIYLMNADGSGQQRITNNSFTDVTPALSPDGSKIVFASYRSGVEGNGDIYVINAAPEGADNPAVNLTANSSADDYSPRFSSDGSKIVFLSRRYDYFPEVMTMNADGSGQTRVTNNAVQDVAPDFSPNGSQIVFFSMRDSKVQIYKINTDGTQEICLTPQSTTGDTWPSGSPMAPRSRSATTGSGQWIPMAATAYESHRTQLMTRQPGVLTER
jgi:Tol biopolymer transport system component